MTTRTGPDGDEAWTYDGAGRAATYTSAGETLSYTWNEHDRVERVERADGSQAQLSWNLDGRPAGASPPWGGIRTAPIAAT